MKHPVFVAEKKPGGKHNTNAQINSSHIWIYKCEYRNDI
jgi:hypothetical protein